ncbi:kilA N-terminal/APSES-type HTH DNA-binding [Firmicutes bacterium CAG:321]|nr:kilA N-terminal/APSES-type HTH DNA-binding [Firmicutes bacterium CAG:321]
MNEKIITKMHVKDNLVKVMRVNGVDYISLTDLARYKNPNNPGDVIIKWMSNKSSFDFYSLWEELFNDNFKLAEFREFKNDAANNSFTMSPSRWISFTNSKGFISKRGKYDGGTFAHPDIALEFASWIDPAFKLYLIKEFERLKHNETYQERIEWSVRRSLSKTNYRIHTDSIKENIVPTLTDKQKLFIYANEADVINVSLFGMTAKEWRENNPDKEGNIRDYTDILHLVVLSNLEVLNASMIENNISQKDRLEKLNKTARRQINILTNDSNIIGITKLDDTKMIE